MTFSIGHVDGGTHAGHRKPMRDKPASWVCSCYDRETIPGPAVLLGTETVAPCVSWEDGESRRYHTQPGYLKTCPVCKTARP